MARAFPQGDHLVAEYRQLFIQHAEPPNGMVEDSCLTDRTANTGNSVQPAWSRGGWITAEDVSPRCLEERGVGMECEVDHAMSMLLGERD